MTLVRPLQPSNAEDPMLVTLSGIVMLVRPLQPENALSLILVTPFGIVTLVKLAFVTPPGTKDAVRFVTETQP